MSEFNPYNYLLEIRENKVLFEYFRIGAVTFDDMKGWTITGESRHGHSEIYQLASNVLRLIISIPVPSIIPQHMLEHIIVKLQPTIEGLVGIDTSTGKPVLQYYIHYSYKDTKGLDATLIQFLSERDEIEDGFIEVERTVKEAQSSSGTLQDMIAQKLKERGIDVNGGPPSEEDEPTSSSLWESMEEIDSKEDEEDK